MESHLKWADYLIIVAFFAISLAIGVYHAMTGGRQRTTAEFVMADRRLNAIPTAMSLLVSFQSSLIFLGMTAEMYCYGVQALVFSIIATALAVLFCERIIVPFLYPLKMVSVIDYLEMRFMSRSIRIFAVSGGILSGVLFNGVSIYAPSAALESVTGLPLVVSIPVMTVVAVTYTALGGMRAVIWTDAFQFLTIFGGLIAILVKGLIAVGGITNVFRLAEEEGRLTWANFDTDPRERHTAWTLLFGLGFVWIQAYGLSQAAVQRFSAVSTLSKARMTILLNIPPVIFINIVSCLIGLVILAYYSMMKCDPLANNDITNPNVLLPYFVVTTFADSPGFSGLFLSTLYGGALSTVSTVLSGSAAVCWENILKWKLSHLPETRKAFINRLLVVLFGALSIGVAFLSASAVGPITQVMMALSSSTNGPFTAFFILGAVSKHANWKGTLLGGIVGVLVSLWLTIGSMMLHHIHPPLPPVSVEHCSIKNGNSTFFSSSLKYVNYSSFEVLDGIDANMKWNQTAETPRGTGSHKTKLRGLENFYAISYLWFAVIGALVTVVVGIIASLLMRDKELEAKVEERLLLRFHCCRVSAQNENQENIDDENHATLQETKVLKESEDDLPKNLATLASTKTEDRFLKKETNKDDPEETPHV